MHDPKKNARVALKYAVDTGKLKRLPCEVCGDKKSEGHHPDCSKPLQVKWLCKLHHVMEHTKQRMTHHDPILLRDYLTEKEFPQFLSASVNEYGLQRIFAEKIGVSPQLLSDMLKGRRNPSDSVLDKLGLKRVVTYQSL